MKEENVSVGLHSIVEFSLCNLNNFCINEGLSKSLSRPWIEILSNIGVDTLGEHVHFFGPNAISISLNLSESHLNFHTWPELNYVAMDFFCCKKSPNLRFEMESVVKFGESFFNSKSFKNIWVKREFIVAY